jgi:hypothetical protein
MSATLPVLFTNVLICALVAVTAANFAGAIATASYQKAGTSRSIFKFKNDTDWKSILTDGQALEIDVKGFRTTRVTSVQYYSINDPGSWRNYGDAGTYPNYRRLKYVFNEGGGKPCAGPFWRNAAVESIRTSA